MRIPTPKQMAKLSCLHVGMAVLNPRRSDWRPMLNHGWVEPKAPETCPENGLRITPHGLRALAAALETYGRASAPATHPREQG